MQNLSDFEKTSLILKEFSGNSLVKRASTKFATKIVICVHRFLVFCQLSKLQMNAVCRMSKKARKWQFQLVS